jgi:hypothetical protein
MRRVVDNGEWLSFLLLLLLLLLLNVIKIFCNIALSWIRIK